MFENTTEIILKVTRDCNLRCQYCYIKDKDKYAKEEMSEEVFKKLIGRVIFDKEKNCFNELPKKLNIVFHGGEPTLLGVEKLQRFIDYAKTKIPYAQFGMQTNMTKIDEQWVNFFRKNDIVPGVSIDGFGKTDNYLREKNELLQQKIEYLRRNKIKHGSLMIITKNNIKSYYENILKMVDRFPDNMIKVNYAENTYTDKPADPEVSAEELYKYVFMPTLKYFFSKNIFIEENFRYTIDRFVKNIVFKEIEDRNYLCYANCLAKFCSGGNSVVEVDADGCVCFCGRWSDVNEVNVLGNYLDKNSDFFGLWSLNKILKLHVEKIADIRNKNCDSCDASDICTFGCIAFSYDKYHGKIKIREDLVCDYVKKIKTLLNKNKYQVIYHYVLSNGWEYKIINKEYYLNIPLLDTRYNYKDFLGNDIKWIQEDGNKFYFKVPAKLIEEKVSWQ